MAPMAGALRRLMNHRSNGRTYSVRYFALIDGEPGAHGVVFPDLPGCTAMGASLDEAIAAAADALADWAETVEEDGRTLPAARPAEELRHDAEVAEALAGGASLEAFMLVRTSGRSAQTNLSLDAGVVAALDAAARTRGVTRSVMVSILVRQHLYELG